MGTVDRRRDYLSKVIGTDLTISPAFAALTSTYTPHNRHQLFAFY